MAAVPTWLIGKYVTSITIIGLAASSTGALSATGTYALTGLLDEITPTATNDTENIVPLDVRQNNEVIVGTGQSLTLVEILNQQWSGGVVGNCLAQVAYNNDYAQFTFTRGGIPFTEIYVIGEYAESIRRGKSVGTLTVKPAGITGGGYQGI